MTTDDPVLARLDGGDNLVPDPPDAELVAVRLDAGDLRRLLEAGVLALERDGGYVYAFTAEGRRRLLGP